MLHTLKTASKCSCKVTWGSGEDTVRIRYCRSHAKLSWWEEEILAERVHVIDEDARAERKR